MKPIQSIVALATLAVGVGACSVSDGYYAPRSQAAYYPATTTAYYGAPAGTTVYTTSAPAYYNAEPPNFRKSNVYSSRWDYYRNYQGAHSGGPERTGW